MNWGKKIMIFYLTFVIGIVFLIYKSSTQNTDLVTPDYYKKELAFQSTIEARKRASGLTSNVMVKQIDSLLIIDFPKEMDSVSVEANVMLYCPSDKNKDITKSCITNDGKIYFPIRQVAKGYYEIHIEWTASNKQYYYEDKLYLK